MAGKQCRAGADCKYSHNTEGVRCIQYQKGVCHRGDDCVFEHGESSGRQRPRSPRTPPRDHLRKRDGTRSGERHGSPERAEEEDQMVYDDDTRMVELLMEAVSVLSGGKPDLAYAEAEAVFRLIRFNGDRDQRSSEWCTWTSGTLTPLQLHDVVKSFEVSLQEVEEWTEDLRIWYNQANLEEEDVPKRGKKRSQEGGVREVTPGREIVPEVSETRVNVEEDMKRVKKRKKAAVTEDPYTLLAPKPKKRPANMEKSGSSKAVVSGEEKPSSKARKSGASVKSQKREKSPGKKEVSVAESPEGRDAPTFAAAETGQDPTCPAVEEAKKEGMISSIQRSVMDPSLTAWDLEQVLTRLRLSIDANRAKAAE